MLESTEAFKKFANGKSWNQLDFKVQQQIRLAAILEQTYARYGDTLASTTQTKQAMFLASLDNIRLNLGNAFLPIYNVVLPALTSLASKLENITAHLASFSQTVFGQAKSVEVTEEYSEAIEDVGDAIEDAGKKAKKAIAPFDEINQIASAAAGNASLISAPTTGRVHLKPVTSEIDNTGTFSDTLNKLKSAVDPTVKALGRLKDALKPIGEFVFDNIKNFYEYALKPIGKWLLGEGLPRLLDVGTGLLKSINWEKLTDALKNLYQALAPFAISVGRGLISFIETMSEVLKPIIATTADLLAKAINAIAKAIKAIPEKVAVAIGGAIGGIAASILLFKGATAVIGTINSLRTAFSGLLSALSADPILAAAAAIGALAGAIIELGKANFKKSEVGQYIIKVDQLTESSKLLNEEIDTLLKNHEQREKDIEAEYGAVSILADQYLNLADKQSLTNEEQALLKAYADELVEKIPQLSELIDAQTGAYKGTREEIQGLIETTKEYYLVQAAKESLIEIAKKQFEAERKLKELEEERSLTKKKLKEQQEALNDAIRKATEEGWDQYDIAKKVYAAHQKYDSGIIALEKSLESLDEQIEENNESQAKLNKIWKYSEDYIKNYSRSVKTDMQTVENAVSNTLSKLETKVRNFKLPNIKIGVDMSLPEYLNSGDVLKAEKFYMNSIKQYAGGGLPPTGELFIANEDGPELIGRIGNRTAVANTDQIVEGITRGVATANAEEVALLKQQNSLLQAILQKTGITTKNIYDAVVAENKTQVKRSGYSPLFT